MQLVHAGQLASICSLLWLEKESEIFEVVSLIYKTAQTPAFPGGRGGQASKPRFQAVAVSAPARVYKNHAALSGCSFFLVSVSLPLICPSVGVFSNHPHCS